MNSLYPVLKELERIYNILSEKFNVKTVCPIITIQSRGRRKNVLGWYGKDKWKNGEKEISEINICAENLNKNPIETLVHEMVHYHNSQLEINDCSPSQYHNKHFKERAEKYGLNVEKCGRLGWASTSLSPELEKIIADIKIDNKIFNVFRQTQVLRPAPTKMKKFSCGCTNVRCAVDLEAICSKCKGEFEEQ